MWMYAEMGDVCIRVACPHAYGGCVHVWCIQHVLGVCVGGYQGCLGKGLCLCLYAIPKKQ